MWKCKKKCREVQGETHYATTCSAHNNLGSAKVKPNAKNGFEFKTLTHLNILQFTLPKCLYSLFFPLLLLFIEGTSSSGILYILVVNSILLPNFLSYYSITKLLLQFFFIAIQSIQFCCLIESPNETCASCIFSKKGQFLKSIQTDCNSEILKRSNVEI